jgi:hypothetical protein
MSPRMTSSSLYEVPGTSWRCNGIRALRTSALRTSIALFGPNSRSSSSTADGSYA